MLRNELTDLNTNYIIHNRRQSAALGEAADVARAELERNPGSPEIRSVLTTVYLVQPGRPHQVKKQLSI